MFSPGKEQIIPAGGKRWTLGRLTVGVIEGFRDFIKEQIGDPFDGLKEWIDKIPQADALRLIEEARTIKKQLDGFSLNCPLAQEWLKNERGMARLLCLMLQGSGKHDGASDDDGLLMLEALGAKGQDVAVALQKGAGEVGEVGQKHPSGGDAPAA